MGYPAGKAPGVPQGIPRGMALLRVILDNRRSDNWLAASLSSGGDLGTWNRGNWNPGHSCASRCSVPEMIDEIEGKSGGASTGGILGVARGVAGGILMGYPAGKAPGVPQGIPRGMALLRVILDKRRSDNWLAARRSSGGDLGTWNRGNWNPGHSCASRCSVPKRSCALATNY
jgi:hypothetical protein